MQNHEHITHYLIGENNFNQTLLSEIKVIQPQRDKANSPDIITFESPIYFVSGWVILGLILAAILTVVRSEMFRVELVPEVPCKKCRFFSSNPYLRCAVHPCTVLTEKAMHCTDYRPQERKLFN
jgi:hypothetical protein